MKKKQAAREPEETKDIEEQAELATPTMQDPMQDSDGEIDQILQTQKT